MIDFNPEEILQKLETSPARPLLESAEFASRVSEIAKKYYFDIDPGENFAFHQLAGIAGLGLLTVDSLAAEIKDRIETDQDSAGAVAREVFSLFSKGLTENKQPLPFKIPLPSETQGIPATPQPAPLPAAPAPLKASVPMIPSTPMPSASPTPAPSPAPAPSATPMRGPFVIHENVEVKPTTEANPDTRGTTRPVFYRPAFAPKEETYPARPAQVKIETAPEQNPDAQPKVVNYSAPAPEQKPAEAVKINQAKAPGESVDPGNIIDLKDLPR